MKILELGRKDLVKDSKKENVIWFVTKNCNYKCVYCGLKRQEEFSDITTYEKIINYINTKCEHSKNVDVTLTGGEVLLHPDIIKIVNGIRAEKLKVKTNASHGYDMFDYFLCSTPSTIHIQLEYHYPFIYPEDYLEKIKYISRRNHFVNVKVFWDVRNKEYTLDVYNQAKLLQETYPNIKVYLEVPQHPFFLWEKEDLCFADNLISEKEFIIKFGKNDNIEEVETTYLGCYNFCVNNKIDNFKDFYCSQTTIIDSNGNLFSCTKAFYEGLPFSNVGVVEDTRQLTCQFSNSCYDLSTPKRSK